ncbi:MAG TPA: hypothetical protein VGB45_01045 [Abditibacterium sp.]|jgi:hypothetical protein
MIISSRNLFKIAFSIALVGTSYSVTAARADIAPDPMSGGISLGVMGKEKTDVSLIHNTVKLQISPSLCKTRAWFRLKNTGPASGFEVGFPLNYQGEAKDFEVWIDGKAQKVEDRAIQYQVPINRLKTRYWKIFPMKFKAKETLLAEVRYSNAPPQGWATTLNSQQGAYPLFSKWRRTGFSYSLADFGIKEGGQMHDWVALRTVQYILVSGSEWKGPIERCRVEANIENIAPDALTDVRPPAHFVSPRQLKWEWKQVNPAENIVINFMGHAPLETIAVLEKIAAKHPDDEAVAETLKAMKIDFPDAATIRERQKSFAAPK